MFGLLKNKITSFIKGLSGREEKKEEKNQEKTTAQVLPVEKEEKPAEKIPEKKTSGLPSEKPAEIKPVPKPAEQPSAKPVEKPSEPSRVPAPAEQRIEKPLATPAGEPQEKKKEIGQYARVPEPISTSAPAPQPVQQQKKSLVESVVGAFSRKAPQGAPTDISRLENRAMGEKKEMSPKIGIGTAIKSIFSSEITIGESEVSDLLSELEISLLEADVAYEVSLEVTKLLRTELVGMKVPKGEVEKRTREAISRILESVMDSDRKFNLVERVKGMPKPVKILFVGPNGVGKTTTMAKVARLLIDSGLSVILAAADTFRAAAIEQTEVHAGNLGIRAIKSKYGADPASVAFDAINYASSHSIDVVLIDSAGRQDTNANLLSELKKIARIAKPDIKLYIGESIGGNSVIEQIKAFNEAIGIDGAILTKIDCDAKGGTAISVSRATGAPVLYLGVGQGYSDLKPFDAHKIAQEIMT